MFTLGPLSVQFDFTEISNMGIEGIGKDAWFS